MRRGFGHFLLPYRNRRFREGTLTCSRSGAGFATHTQEFAEESHRVLESIRHLLHTLYDVEGLIRWGGPFLVCLIVFIETGFFVGFFLPGDSLLVTAGVLSAGEVTASVVSYWELVLKKGRKTALVLEPKAWWERYITRPSVKVLPVRPLRAHHSDILPAGGWCRQNALVPLSSL